MKNYYYKNKNQNILPLQNQLSVQSLSVQKRGKRLELRLPEQLKILIEKIAVQKNESASELTILLWLDYLSKTGYIAGKAINKNAEDLKADVEYFLKSKG